VFDLLKTKNVGETYVIMSDESRICEITKQYFETGFPEDDLSVGYAVDVTQESINNTIREYLVNFTYLTRVLDDYGFVLATDSEAKQMGFKKGTGLFDELFAMMDEEIKKNPQKKSEYKSAQYMTAGERKLSFLNRYFIFKKVRSVDAKKIEGIVLRKEQILEMTEPGADETESQKQEIIDPFVQDIKDQLKKQKQDELKPKKPRLKIKNKTKMVLMNNDVAASAIVAPAETAAEAAAAEAATTMQEIKDLKIDETPGVITLKEKIPESESESESGTNPAVIKKPKLRIKPKTG